MPRDFTPPDPPPGWTSGTCYCGCGTLLKPGRKFWCSKGHRSTRAPDGRPVTEVSTKWCKTCSQRLPLSAFPLRMVRRAKTYVERPSFYCDICYEGQLNKLAEVHLTDEGRKRNRERMVAIYSDPLGKEMFKANAARRRRAIKEDPERLKAERKRRRREWMRYKRTKKYRNFKEQRAEKARLLRQELRAEDQDPLVISRDDPMMGQLYQWMDQYLNERGITGIQVFGPILGGKNWMRWRPEYTMHGGQFMSLSQIDAVLVRMDLAHRLHDFEFERRSVLKRASVRGTSSRAG